MKIKKAFTMFAAATAVVSITPVQACVPVQPCLKNINTENIFQEESMVVCKENENIVDTDKRTIDENSTGISETNNVDETDMQPCDDTFDVETPDSLDNADMSKLEDQASDGTAIEDNKIDVISTEDVNDSTDPDDNINEEADIPDMDDTNDATLQQSEGILDDEIMEDQDDTDMLETGEEEIENNDESIEDNIDPINSDALFENEDDALDNGDRKYVSFEAVNVKAPTVDARQGTLSQPDVTNIETLPSDDNVKSISEPMLAENKTQSNERTTQSKQRSSSVDGITLSNDSKSVNNPEIKPEPSNSDDANFSNKDEDLNSSVSQSPLLKAHEPIN